MSIKVMMRVWEHSGQRGSARCLMLAIADLANDDGIAWPGTARLADKINESQDYTDKIIARCLRSGELLRVSGRGRGHTTRFAVLCGLHHDAIERLKGVLQNPYPHTPFEPKSTGKGYSRTPITEKRGTTKGVLSSEKRGTLSDAKQSAPEASESDETQLLKNDTLHDPLVVVDLPPPTMTHDSRANGGGGGGQPSPSPDPIARLFAGYEIKQADALSQIYRDHWPEITLEQLTILCARYDDPSAGSYRGSRLYRQLKNGPPAAPERAARAVPPEPPRPPPVAGLTPTELRTLSDTYHPFKRGAPHAVSETTDNREPAPAGSGRDPRRDG